MMNSIEFSQEIQKFDKKIMSQEIYWWLKENLNSYIDNHQMQYSLSFLAHEDNMKECAKFEHFCALNTEKLEVKMDDIKELEEEAKKTMGEAIDEESKGAQAEKAVRSKFDDLVDDESKKIDAMVEFMDGVKAMMEADKDRLEDYFKSLTFFYNIAAFYKGRPVEAQNSGYLKISYLSFENFEMDVSRTPLVPKVVDGKVVGYTKGEKQIISKLPPSFVIDFSIDIWRNQGVLNSALSIF